MLISHFNKWIFIHIPKTGGSSITSSLWSHADVQGASLQQLKNPSLNLPNKKIDLNFFQHDTSAEISQKMQDHGYHPYKDYFSFAFVRNPWSRAVSTWVYWNKLVSSGKGFPWCIEAVNNCENFSEFVFSKYFSDRSQLDFLTNQKGDIIVDYIGKLETIEKDFLIISKKLNLNNLNLPHENSTKHRFYTKFYNKDTISKVYNTYNKDIDFFGYDFGK